MLFGKYVRSIPVFSYPVRNNEYGSPRSRLFRVFFFLLIDYYAQKHPSSPSKAVVFVFTTRAPCGFVVLLRVCVCVCLCVLLSRRRACDPFSLDITRADVYTQGCGVHNVRRYGVSFLFPPVDLSVVIRLGKVEYDRIFRTFSSGRSSVCMTETVYGRVLVTNAPCQWSATTL